MSRAVKKPPTLRDVEEKLFRYLYGYKVATSRQIARDVYPGITHQALYKRLNLLTRASWIQANYMKELGGRLIYSLAPKSFEQYICGGDLGLRREFQSSNPLHDLDLLDLGERLKTLRQVTRYVPENVLKAGVPWDDNDSANSLAALKPDAVFSVQFRDGALTMPIEYERTAKAATRYEGLLRKYYGKPEIAGVVFIARDGSTLRKVQETESRWLTRTQGQDETASKFFYSSLERVIDPAQANAEFVNLRNERLLIH